MCAGFEVQGLGFQVFPKCGLSVEKLISESLYVLQSITIPITRTPKKGVPVLGNHHIGSFRILCIRRMKSQGTQCFDRQMPSRRGRRSPPKLRQGFLSFSLVLNLFP